MPLPLCTLPLFLLPSLSLMHPTIQEPLLTSPTDHVLVASAFEGARVNSLPPRRNKTTFFPLLHKREVQYIYWEGVKSDPTLLCFYSKASIFLLLSTAFSQESFPALSFIAGMESSRRNGSMVGGEEEEEEEEEANFL